MVMNPNLQVPIPETLLFTLFWAVFHVPWGLLWLKTSPKCHYVCRYRGFLWCRIQIYSSQYLKIYRLLFFGMFFAPPGGILGLNRAPGTQK